MALITAAEARDLIPSLASAEEGTLLGTLVSRVGGIFARRCGYPAASAGAMPTMESTSYTLDHTSDGGRDLMLRVSPATAITSVRDDPTGDFSDAAYLVPSADYAILGGGDGRVLRLTSTSSWGSWGTGRGRIRVVFTAGFVTVPEDLKQLAAAAVRHVWDQRSKQTRKSVSMQGDSIQYSDDMFLPEHVLAGLGFFLLPGGVL